MLREVHLGGQLGKRFGRHHKFDIATPAEALRALEANHPGFMNEVVRLGEQGYGYRVLHGKSFKLGIDDGKELLQPCSGAIRIQPEIMGSKRGGIGQILMAVVLVAAAVYTGGLAAVGPTQLFGMSATTVSSSLMSAGIAMAVGGVIQLLSPQQGASTPDEDKSNPSYVFDGAVNTMAQGHPVPVGYGEMIVGSAVISAGIDVTEEAIAPSAANNPTYTDGEGNVVLYPAPTLVWDNNIGNYRLPNGEKLLFDSVWNESLGTFEVANFRTADGRLPVLNATPPAQPRYDIPNPTSTAKWRKSGSTFYWSVMSGVDITYVSANQRWEIPESYSGV